MAKKTIDKYVKANNLLSFVIGKTDNIENRQNDERYKGYKLCKITEDTPDVINRLEKALIRIFHVSNYYKDLHEDQNEGGQGNDKADKLYVAIKTKNKCE